MDTFTIVVAVMTLLMVYFGERFRTGAYFAFAAMFDILLAWRMAEEVFYMASAAFIVFLLYRAFYPQEDIRDMESER